MKKSLLLLPLLALSLTSCGAKENVKTENNENGITNLNYTPWDEMYVAKSVRVYNDCPDDRYFIASQGIKYCVITNHGEGNVQIRDPETHVQYYPRTYVNEVTRLYFETDSPTKQFSIFLEAISGYTDFVILKVPELQPLPNLK